MESMNQTPLYQLSASYAREHGELDLYRQSLRANIACKEAIESAVSQSFDGMRLKHDAPTAVLDQFGAERVQHVLAATVQLKLWDGRFSSSNKSWSQTITPPDQVDAKEFVGWARYAVSSHPAVLDGFIQLTRKEVQEREKPSVKDALRQVMPENHHVPAKKEAAER